MNEKDFKKLIEESAKEDTLTIKQAVDLVSQIEYIDASPKRLKQLSERLSEIMLTPKKDDKIKEEGKKILDEFMQINIVLKQGKTIEAKEFNDKFKKIMTEKVMASLEIVPEDIWKISPFKELGMVRIGKKKMPRIKHICHPIIVKSEKEISKSGEFEKSSTFHMQCSCAWAYFPMFIIQDLFIVIAESKTYASGFHAADPMIQEACLDESLEPIVQAIFCIFAAAYEKKRYRADYLAILSHADCNSGVNGSFRINRNRNNIILVYEVWCSVWDWNGCWSAHASEFYDSISDSALKINVSIEVDGW